MARKTKTTDGNTAAAYVSYALTDVAAIYSITPSSMMADETDEYAANGLKNLFDKEVQVTEMQSEAGAAGVVHGSLAIGALTMAYTASQGLLPMTPNMYKMAGELPPAVIHISVCALATHTLSTFGGRSDTYACHQTGFAMLCSSNLQEVMDLGAVVYLATIRGRAPFPHFFDGFRTSHEVQKVPVWDYKDLNDMFDQDAVAAFRRRVLNPEHSVLRGSAQNGDIFFQARETSNPYYDAVLEIVTGYMNKVSVKLGTDYKPFNYYGYPKADRVIVAMGSVRDYTEEVIDYLNAAGEKVGLLKVHLYRPFAAKYLLSELSKSVKKVPALDRTKESGSIGEPLFLDVLAALSDSDFSDVSVYSGRYSLGSKDTTPDDTIAVYRNTQAEAPKKRFTIGIVDDLTHLSLPIIERVNTVPKGTYSYKFWGLGVDGTVGADKNSIKIIGDHTDILAQGYFDYDSKKSGGLTVSHLCFGDKPVKSTYYISQADFVAYHNLPHIDKYDIVEDPKKGGSFLLNCPWDAEELDHRLSGKMKRFTAQDDIHLYTTDGIKIGRELSLGGRTNTISQAAFFKTANIILTEQAAEFMKAAATRSYSKKGDKVVAMNRAATDYGVDGFAEVQVPESWKNAPDTEAEKVIKGDCPGLVSYAKNALDPVNVSRDSKLTASTFKDYMDGTVPQGSAAYEERSITVDVPEWQPENYTQCNFCSYACPHTVVRPLVMTPEELANVPAQTRSKDLNGLPGLEFTIAASTLDCTGCGSCAQVCPGMEGNKAPVLKPTSTQLAGEEVLEYGRTLSEKPEVFEKFKEITVKGSQFYQPLLELSGACAGCGETPYVKLTTQLFGDRTFIANATGCSSVWGGSASATPYIVGRQGRDPVWANSLFEDNAEFGFGMALGQEAVRNRLIDYVENILALNEVPAELKEACQKYIDTLSSSGENKKAAIVLLAELEKALQKGGELARLVGLILDDSDHLAKKSTWILGGDDWAYDIGFGGLDHVIASDENMNILVFDTEVYSNTGGQVSKTTPTGSVAQSTATGKAIEKKDLVGVAMTYDYAYVAHVAMGADYNQCLKAFCETESYSGLSLIVVYVPCIDHGIKGGMTVVQAGEKKAAASGYWHNYRFDPRRADEGKNSSRLDSKTPTESYRDFILGEVRYSSLTRAFPDRAERLSNKTEEDAKKAYEDLETRAKE